MTDLEWQAWWDDDRNLSRFMREAERYGFIESFVGEDGQPRWRRTSKQMTEAEGDEIATRLLQANEERLT
jgi:hypothetical protein